MTPEPGCVSTLSTYVTLRCCTCHTSIPFSSLPHSLGLKRATRPSALPSSCTMASMGKNWTLWAEYLYCLQFELDSNSTLGLSVVSCYLNACRSQKEAKCRKYLARIIWMLTHDYQQRLECGNRIKVHRICWRGSEIIYS